MPFSFLPGRPNLEEFRSKLGPTQISKTFAKLCPRPSRDPNTSHRKRWPCLHSRRDKELSASSILSKTQEASEVMRDVYHACCLTAGESNQRTDAVYDCKSWSRFGVCYSHSSRSARVWFIAFMGDGPYANTRHHAIRRLAAEAQLQANSVVTPAALGGQPPRTS